MVAPVSILAFTTKDNPGSGSITLVSSPIGALVIEQLGTFAGLFAPLLGTR
jgi:hypothetical protein